jgi:hypothetical protein
LRLHEQRAESDAVCAAIVGALDAGGPFLNDERHADRQCLKEGEHAERTDDASQRGCEIAHKFATIRFEEQLRRVKAHRLLKNPNGMLQDTSHLLEGLDDERELLRAARGEKGKAESKRLVACSWRAEYCCGTDRVQHLLHVPLKGGATTLHLPSIGEKVKDDERTVLCEGVPPPPRMPRAGL